MQEYVNFWKNFANFSDRTTVRGYWMAFLVNFLISMVLGALVKAVPTIAFVSGIYSLAAFIPGLAIVVRRLRDAGKSWAWMFINLIPLVGQIIFLVMLCKASTPENPTNAATV